MTTKTNTTINNNNTYHVIEIRGEESKGMVKFIQMTIEIRMIFLPLLSFLSHAHRGFLLI